MWIDDQIFAEAAEDISLRIWEPDRPLIVLGRSNQAEVECNLAQCEMDGVEILKRAGGGGTVVLFPGCAIISCGMWVSRAYHNDHYFRLINQSVINCLAEANSAFAPLEQSGISDLSYKGRKCAGTSMFRSRNYLLYQASVIVRTDIELISRYLAHPSREPEYRMGRDHRDFLISLCEIAPETSVVSVNACLKKRFADHLRNSIGEELIPSRMDQADYIRQKSESTASGS